MLRERSQLLNRGHQLLDLCLVGLSFVLAYVIKQNLLPAGFAGLHPKLNYPFVLLLSLVVFFLCFNIFNFYESFRRQTFYKIFLKIVKAVFAGFLLIILICYLLKVQDFSRIMMGIFVILTGVLLIVSKGIIFHVLVTYRKRGFNFRNILLIGSRERAREMIRAVMQNPGAGYRLLGCLEVDGSLVGSAVDHGVMVIGTLADFRTIILNSIVDEVVFAMPLQKIKDVREHIAFAEEVGVSIRILPDWQIQKIMYQPETASVYLEQFIGMPTIGLSSTPQKGTELLIKAFIDYVAAVVGVVVLSPVFLFIALFIKLDSRGPIFFKQERCGVNGRRFTLYKFRTMVVDAEKMREELADANEMDGPVFKIKDDPRITLIGKFLRKTSLDELPQLINILKGEMSVVGPRPPLPSEVEKYKPWQRRRLSMKPGLTCIWQVSGRNGVDFEKWMRMDLEYIDNWSLLLDMKLIFSTIKVVLYGTGK